MSNHNNKAEKPKSTNPFDWSDSEKDDGESIEKFFDCNDGEQEPTRVDPVKTRRKAPLNFNFNYAFDSEPALNFDRVNTHPVSTFVSPLEGAMLEQLTAAAAEENDCLSMDSSLESEPGQYGGTEETPLLTSRISFGSLLDKSQQSYDGKVMNGVKIPKGKKGRRKSQTGGNASRRSLTKKSLVLKELDTSRDDFFDSARDYKMIRLEDLGTASSWLVLLLPYFAFVVCLLMESRISIATTGPLKPVSTCFDDTTSSGRIQFPIIRMPSQPCFYPFDMAALKRLKSLGGAMIDFSRQWEGSTQPGSSTGQAFEAGPLLVPPSTTTFYADVAFVGLSTETVAMVSKGMVFSTGLLFQKQKLSAEWSLVANSRSERLSMACYSQNKRVSKNSSRWKCNSPRMIEVLFSMPGSAIISGGELRAVVLFTTEITSTTGHGDSDESFVSTSEEFQAVLDGLKPSEIDINAALSELMHSSAYVISHTSVLTMRIDIFGRIVAMVITFAFATFWCWRVGVSELLFYCDCRNRDELFEIRKATSLLESPWVLFPERWYILLLLLSLLFIQSPFVVAMYFSPGLNAQVRAHTVADTLVGVAVHGVLFVYLCLFQGFQYHNAKIARKWMEQHRNLVNLRRAAKEVFAEQAVNDASDAAIARYIAEYFQRHGDIDGTASMGRLRLYHDPFGDNWADFLLPKVLIFTVGVVSIFGTAYSRFHFSSEKMQTANAVYLVSYLVQFAALVLWLALIVRSAFQTGDVLRREPFLSTRPAQLAYRILFAHMSLGILALAVIFLRGVGSFTKQWRFGNQTQVPEEMQQAGLEYWLRLVTRVTERFPYSGTASSIGFGKIFYATTSILITAFIFLPHHRYIDSGEGDEIQRNSEMGFQRKDKRIMVRLARYAHTWRVFPLPIQRASVFKQMLLEDFFQLYLNRTGKDYTNGRDRGLISVGTYTPVFCVELACWLLEAAFQAYYSPEFVTWDDSAPGKMSLSSIGLRLEAAIFDEATNTQAFIATTLADQVDGEEDQIIVIAFRGSVDASNVYTDLKSRMVPLHDQFFPFDSAPFRVTADRVDIQESDGWIWNAPITEPPHQVRCFSPKNALLYKTGCFPFGGPPPQRKPSSAVSSGAIAVLSVTPVARDTLPCVHEGFQEVYTQLRRKIIESLLPVLHRQFTKALARKARLDDESAPEPLVLPKMYLTGHSMGGALAQLLALDLASNCELVLDIENNTTDLTTKIAEAGIFQLPTPTNERSGSVSPQRGGKRDAFREELSLQPAIAVYTFGQPRVGNRAFSRLYKQRVPHTFRVATEGDPITSLPKVVCSGIYKHAGLEVVLDEGKNGATLVGPTIVETLFRFHQVRTSFAAHSTDRYRDCLESALEPHELSEYYKGHSGTSDAETGFGVTGLGALKHRELPSWMTQGRSSQQP